MSHASASQIDAPARTVAQLCAWPLAEPRLEEPFDSCVVAVRMAAPQILAHQLDAGRKQLKRHGERFGW
jgi:hypothetical protein